MQSQPYAQAPVTQQYVGVGPRFLATLIDSILIVIVGYLLNVMLGTVGEGLAGLLALIYIIAMEATQGATVGKMLLGLRVVREDDGSPISWSEAVVRTLLRIVDALFAYLVGAILIWTSPRKQRLGDRVAHTVVIRTR